MNGNIRVYIAGKIGTENEKILLEKVDSLCKKMGFKTFLPHRDVGIAKNISDSKKIFEGDINYGKTELLTNENLEEIYKLVKSTSKSDVYIIFTGSYAEKPSSVGLVIQRDAIFIFNDAIELLSERGYVKDLLEKTTIMHEWGHLLGLEHINYSNCIMNEMAEVYDNPPVGKNLPIKYCWEELNIIRN